MNNPQVQQVSKTEQKIVDFAYLLCSLVTSNYSQPQFSSFNTKLKSNKYNSLKFGSPG